MRNIALFATVVAGFAVIGIEHAVPRAPKRIRTASRRFPVDGDAAPGARGP